MKEGPSPPSPLVPTDALLPAPKLSRVLVFAGIAALAGAALWGLLAYSHGVESGWFAWGIGVGVGFAAVKGGGHGNATAAAACALTVASIFSGKCFAFDWIVARTAADHAASLDAEAHALWTVAAKDWVALGPDPDADRIVAFLYSYGLEPMEPEEFAATEGVRLARFAERQPTLEQWRVEERADIVAGASFASFLSATWNPFDVLFVLLGIGSAFGIVSNHTLALRVQVRAAERRRRDTEAALAWHAAQKAEQQPAGRTRE